MNKYDPNVHHRRSVRLYGYDYSETGSYFVTICTHEQTPLFGKINNGEMQLNSYGRIANKHWMSITSQFPNTFLHEFVIMPNHIHGIIEINNNPAPKNNHELSNHDMINPGGFAGTMNPMPCVNLARIVRWYKGRTTFECRKKQFTFAWQRSYYEHIIRDDEDHYRIAEYIINNPASWQEDRLYTEEHQ